MKEHLTFWRVIAVLVVVALLLNWWQQNRGGGGGGDYTSAERAAREAVVRLAIEYEALAKAQAEVIRRGDVETDVQVIEWGEQYVPEARKRAFGKLNSILQKDMPRSDDGTLNRTEAAAFYEAQARGFGSIK